MLEQHTRKNNQANCLTPAGWLNSLTRLLCRSWATSSEADLLQANVALLHWEQHFLSEVRAKVGGIFVRTVVKRRFVQ